MKHKTAELEGALLDAAVAKAEGRSAAAAPRETRFLGLVEALPLAGALPYSPSSSWEHGGPVIERERITLDYLGGAVGWSANWDIRCDEGSREDLHTGPTPLIAAMRAYVASKFGDVVDLP